MKIFGLILAILLSVSVAAPFAVAQTNKTDTNHTKTPSVHKSAEHLLYMDLPEAARNALDSKVLKSDILEISKYEQGEKLFYRVKVKEMDKVGVLVVSANGVFLNSDSKHEPQKNQNEKVRLHREKKNL